MRLRFELVDVEETPLGQLTLHRYATDDGQAGYEVRIDDAFLMATHGAAGEVAMVPWALDALDQRDARVLVGGLGAGHTLRAVVARNDVARVDVVELGARVVAWNRRYFGNGDLLDDARVQVVTGDVVSHLEAVEACHYDALLLDVDNGPRWLAAPGNGRLYAPAGLAACAAALRPGGVIAFWSPAPDPALRAALEAHFDDVEVRTSLADVADAVHLARRRPAPPPV